jgi:hypothetical protein
LEGSTSAFSAKVLASVPEAVEGAEKVTGSLAVGSGIEVRLAATCPLMR